MKSIPLDGYRKDLGLTHPHALQRLNNRPPVALIGGLIICLALGSLRLAAPAFSLTARTSGRSPQGLEMLLESLRPEDGAAVSPVTVFC